MIYVIPNFQNPTGITMSLERRLALAELASRHKIPLVEDNPYGELCYDSDTQLPAVKSFDRNKSIVYLGSTSKILCPGFRVGWIYTDNPEFYRKFVLCKQASDLHTGEFNQRVIARYLRNYDIDNHIAKLRNLYRHRRDLMLRELDKKLSQCVNYMRPGGGLFLWLTLPKSADTTAMLEKAAEKKVSYLHGEAFYASEGVKNSIRLNFSNMSDEQIIEGIDRLGRLLHVLL